jgi:superfamily II DNA/RNA helicase
VWAFNPYLHVLCSRTQLAKEGALNLQTVKHFILDECDKMVEKLGE